MEVEGRNANSVEKDTQHSSKNRSFVLKILLKQKLLLATAVGVILGILLGILLRNLHVSGDGIIWVKIWGEIFLRVLKLVMLPLMVSCLVTGISTLQGKAGGYAGMFTLLYVFGTQIFSSVMAIVFCVLIKPGSNWQTDTMGYGNETDIFANSTQQPSLKQTHTGDIIADLLRNLFPDNIIRICIQFTETVRETSGNGSTSQVTGLMHKDGTNMLGLIMCSIAIGFASSAVGEEGMPLLNVFKSLSKVMIAIMDVIMWYTPIAIISLVATSIVGIDNIGTAMVSIGLYVITFLVCAFLHQFVLLPLVYLIILRKNPYLYYLQIVDGILVICGATSGMVALPIFLNTCKNKLGMNKGVVDFVLPLLVSISRNGSPMFVTVSLYFIASTNSVILGPVDLLTMCLLTSLMASTVPAIPSGSIIMMITVASSLNLSIDNRLSIILGLEWILDRVRTTNNVAGSGYGCAIVEHLCMRFNKMSSKEMQKEYTPLHVEAETLM